MRPWNYGVLGLVFLAAGCATFDVRTDYDVSADFSRYTTYNFADVPTHPTAVLFSPLNQERMREAIAAAMEERGYKQAIEPDLLVHINLVTTERQKLFANYNYSYWGPRNDYVINYTEGTLVIDLTDAARHKLVWQGVAVGIVKEGSRNVEQQIGKVVEQLFAKYPYTAGTGGERIAR